MNIRWTEERLRVLVADLADMGTETRLAQKYGLPYPNIRYACIKAEKLGLLVRRAGHRIKWTDDKLRKLFLDYQTHGDLKALSEVYGICKSGLSMRLTQGHKRGLFVYQVKRGKKRYEVFTDGRWDAEALRQLGVEYKQTGSLEAVGKLHNMTRERARQLLNKGRELGLCAYSPKWRQCEVVRRLPEVLKQATSMKEINERLGYARDTSGSREKFFKRLGVLRSVKNTVQQNKLNKLLDDLIAEADRLGCQELNSYTLQTHCRPLYARADREFGGIRNMRKAVERRRREVAFQGVAI